MIPLLPFAAGLAAGVFGIRLLKGVKGTDYRSVNAAARERLARTGDGLRQATVAGLSAIEQSSASLRSRLTPDPAATAELETAAAPKRRRAGRPKAAAASAAPSGAASAVAEAAPAATPARGGTRKRSSRKVATAPSGKAS